MKPAQTGIAVAIALVVVAVFFLFPGLSPFNMSAKAPADETAQISDPAQLAATAQATETTSNNITMPTITELQIKDEVIGTGETAAAGDSVTVTYVGALTDGKVFDASANHPETVNGFEFPLGAGRVIKGWDQGIVGMKVGGKRTLLIPASLAYGEQAVGGVIPANSALIFQVELLKVMKPR